MWSYLRYEPMLNHVMFTMLRQTNIIWKAEGYNKKKVELVV